MIKVQSVQTCRWGSPTLFLPWPFWLELAGDEWSCTRGLALRGLADPSACGRCAYWAASSVPLAGSHDDDDDHLGATAS